MRKSKAPVDKPTIKGMVKSRKCKHCGHHEIGVVTDSGEYIALKPGMNVIISVMKT